MAGRVVSQAALPKPSKAISRPFAFEHPHEPRRSVLLYSIPSGYQCFRSSPSISSHTSAKLSSARHLITITSLRSRTGTTILIISQNLLLQHNAVHTSLQQREHQARFPLQAPQRVQNISGGSSGEGVEEGCQLPFNASAKVSLDLSLSCKPKATEHGQRRGGSQGGGSTHIIQIPRQPRIFVQDLLLQRRQRLRAGRCRAGAALGRCAC